MSEENVACPVCGESFIDKRGLTSHARHKHDINSEQLTKKFEAKKNGAEYPDHYMWKIFGGIAVAALTLLAIKRFK